MKQILFIIFIFFMQIQTVHAKDLALILSNQNDKIYLDKDTYYRHTPNIATFELVLPFVETSDDNTVYCVEIKYDLETLKAQSLINIFRDKKNWNIIEKVPIIIDNEYYSIKTPELEEVIRELNVASEAIDLIDIGEHAFLDSKSITRISDKTYQFEIKFNPLEILDTLKIFVGPRFLLQVNIDTNKYRSIDAFYRDVDGKIQRGEQEENPNASWCDIKDNKAIKNVVEYIKKFWEQNV